MLLYLIRHGIALERTDWPHDDDRRPLTVEGRDRLVRIAAGLRAIDVGFDRIVSSPLVRAEQTAEILREGLDGPALQFSDRLRPEADPALLPALLQRCRADERIALVGHEPHMSAALAYLLTGDDAPVGPFKKGAVACLETRGAVAGGAWALRWFVPPKLLVAMRPTADTSAADDG